MTIWDFANDNPIITAIICVFAFGAVVEMFERWTERCGKR